MKLTLSVEDDVISQSKIFAHERGTSVSEMVETYLASIVMVPKLPEPKPASPVLRSVRGSLKKGELQDYRDHLAAKYR